MATPVLQKQLSAANMFRCLECGKCTAVCPISRYNGSYSPRRIVGRMISEDPANVALDPNIWTCLTCGLCATRCPQDVKFGHLMQSLRAEAYRMQNLPTLSHGGALQATMQIMATSDHPQDRLGWVTDDLKISETGSWAYWVGCAPYFDAMFSDLKAETVYAAKSAIRLLNAVGVEPVLYKDERCCGHDLLWGGDVENFKKLAERNVKMIRESGIKWLIVSCPEGYRTLAVDYPKVVGPLGFEVVYITEFLAERMDEFKTKLADVKRTVSYQDPCRLGRHMKIFKSPRQLINAVPGLTFNEMRKSGKSAICCGTSAWQNCDATSKRIQTDRLVGAYDVGADLMITSCPKCYIHFKCALQGESIPDGKKVEVKDLITVLADALEGKPV